MARTCPHCGTQVGDYATTCWQCKGLLEDVYGDEIGAPEPKSKSRTGPIIIAVITVVVIIALLMVLFLYVLNPGAEGITATHLLDDYDAFNYKSYDIGDTIILRDVVDDTYYHEAGDVTFIDFKYYGSDEFDQDMGFWVTVPGDVTCCSEGEYITLQATVTGIVKENGNIEDSPHLLDWQVVDTSSC